MTHEPTLQFVEHFKMKHSLTHAQTDNLVHIVTSVLLNLAAVLSRWNKCL